MNEVLFIDHGRIGRISGDRVVELRKLPGLAEAELPEPIGPALLAKLWEIAQAPELGPAEVFAIH